MFKCLSQTPILRIYDEDAARGFYLDFLGFETLFEHRFDANAPLYMAVSCGGCVLHLSGHHGSAAPHAHVRIEIDDVDAYATALRAKNYRHARPGGGENTPWGTYEMTLHDPFSNLLTFFEDAPKPPPA